MQNSMITKYGIIHSIEVTCPVHHPGMTYAEAIIYCQFLEHNGHIDWRLPTEEEYLNDSRVFGWYITSFRDLSDTGRRCFTPVRDI